jgi:hypothetical protein
MTPASPVTEPIRGVYGGTIGPVRRQIALVVVILIAIGGGIAAAGTVPPGGTFVDDDGSVHEADIEALATAGFATGCAPERFCPEDLASRGAMAALLHRILDFEAPAGVDTFTDDDTSPFEVPIEAIAAAGVTFGCNPPANDRFCPDEPVTRGQMAAFLVRAFEFAATAPDAFDDDNDSEFEADIETLAGAGVTVGCNPPANDRFCPDDLVTRAQLASFLVRAAGITPMPVPEREFTLEVVSREDWGAEEPRGTFTAHAIERLTVHHSGPPASASSGPAVFRGWQDYHFSLGWPDLAYHYIVGRDGVVYEARPADAVGDTATDYDPTGHLLVVVEGDYEVEVPSAAQLEALARLLAWAASTYGVSADTIGGHRDHAATTCPGDNLYTYLADGSLQDRVDELIAAGGVALIDG